MDYRLLVDTALLAGEIMLSSGAETYRVEDTVYHILKVSNLERCDVFVVSMSIMVSIADSNLEAISRVRNVENRTINLGNIYYVNDISRKLCREDITLEDAHEQLQDLLKVKRYPQWLIYICTIISATSFTMLFGATWLECTLAAFNALFVIISRILYAKVRINRFVSNMAVCCIMAITTSVFVRIPNVPIGIEPIIAGSIMPLLPGVALTNAIRDTLQGDYVSGTARLVEAFVTAASLAVGIAAGLAVGNALFGGIL